MARLIGVTLIAALLLLGTAPAEVLPQSQRRNSPFWKSLTPGPYVVGFRVLYFRDPVRRWIKAGDSTTDPGRPIRVSVWYPALPSRSDRQMKYGDYLHHSGPSGFTEIDEHLDAMDKASWLSDARELAPPGEPLLHRLLTTPVAAYRDVPWAGGSFPLVLYSGGKGSRADDNVELGEFLASYGYVMATVPQLGPSNQEIELGSSPREIALHADDLDAAFKFLRALPGINFNQIAAAGHSAGGEVAAELALRHPEISAVIGLDASFGMTSGARIFKQLPEYAPRHELRSALLDLRRAEGSQGVKLDLSVIDALRWTDIYRVEFREAYHGDFTEWGMVSWKLSIPMPPNSGGHTRLIGYEVNRRACHAVLAFLNAELRGQQEELADMAAEMLHETGVTLQHFSGSAKHVTN